MAIDSTKLLVAVKAYSRGNALPLDASSVHETLAAAQTYADSAIAYGGQVITALVDGKYKAYILQPKAEGTGFNLSPIGIDGEIDPTKVKEYVKVVGALPETDQEQGVIYINTTDNKGYIYTGSGFKVIFEQVENLKATIEAIQAKLDSLTGEGEGSVKKALADAKAYTDTTVAGKADKATTLAGYGIADAYTKEATDTAIASAIAKADHLKRAIVDTLPAVDEADANTIYMVPVDDHYDEYILVVASEVKKFEKIGDSKVDLSDYATKNEVATAKQAAIDAAATDATSKADKALEGAKADSALQATDVVSGTANGTISVKGSDVAVKGLGSAAYQNSDVFDASGAAAGALTEAKAYADTKKTEAVDAAAADATTKADNALTAAKKYADGLIELGTL